MDVLSFTRSMRDRVGEGKASGNLGNTFKMLGRFDEAIECCTTHLVTSKELNDQVSSIMLIFALHRSQMLIYACSLIN